jgi:hypothetical protein
MASQFHFVADIHGDLLIVTESRSEFFAVYELGADNSELVLVRQSPFADDALLIASWRVAKDKARELGWIV